MSREIIKNGILDSLESIIEMVSVINRHEEAIPQIETDILLERIRRMYHDVLKLNDFAASPVQGIKTLPTQKKEITPSAIPIIPEKEPELEPTREATPEVEVKTQLVEPILAVETDTAKSIEKQNKEVVEEKQIANSIPQHDLFETSTTVADKLKKESISLHDKLTTNSNENSLVNKVHKKPITNLRQAIGINDKFLFINHLFSGDMKAYDQLIDQLNAASELSEANSIIEQHSAAKNWDNKIPAYIKLREITEKRF